MVSSDEKPFPNLAVCEQTKLSGLLARKIIWKSGSIIGHHNFKRCHGDSVVDQGHSSLVFFDRGFKRNDNCCGAHSLEEVLKP